MKCLDRIPLWRLVTRGRLRRDPLAAAVFVLIALNVCWIAGKIFSADVARASLKHFHLQDPSFAAWSAQQLVPSMYNYANDLYYSSVLMEGGQIRHPELLNSDTYHHRWMNHYPLRFVSFGLYRHAFFPDSKAERFVILRSRFRGQGVLTRYFLKISDGRLTFEPIDTESYADL